MDSPCYDRRTHTDCPLRKSGCAATCKEWSEYQAKMGLEYKRRAFLREVIIDPRRDKAILKQKIKNRAGGNK